MKLNEILEKYPQTNNEWGLHTYNFGNSTSLGKRISWMYNELILNCGLDTNWIFLDPIDYEHKQYVLLAYLKKTNNHS